MVEPNNHEPTSNNEPASPKIIVSNFSEEQTDLRQSQQQLESKPLTTTQYDQTVNDTGNKHSKIVFSLVTIFVIIAVLVGSLIYWSNDKNKPYKSTNNLTKVTQTTNQPASTNTNSGSGTSATSNPYKNSNVNNKVQENEKYCSNDPLLC
jgi:hypothetical protein